jgi:ATP-dependent Clp protease protease subunit
MKLNKLMQLLKDNARAEGPAPIRMDATATEAHIYVNDVIDSYWGASAASLITALAGHQDKIVHLHINSPGGDVFEARAMSAAVVSHPSQVVAHIDGLCASAATYLALACNEVRMTDGGLFMVHNSWTLAYGNKSELRDTANLLEKIDGTIIADYARKTGATTDQVVAWMDATTWFTAQEALDAKFIDAIDTNTKQTDSSKAQWNLSAYPNAPKAAEPPADNTLEPDLTALAAQQIQINRNRLRLITPI